MNDEVRDRGVELNRANTFLESILASMRGGVIVVDDKLEVLMWNEKSQDLWGLRQGEVRGKHFLALDIGLPVEKLKQPLRDCLAGTITHVNVSVVATNRRGRPIDCSVTVRPLMSSDKVIRGAIIAVDAE